VTVTGENKNGFGSEFVGHDHRAFDQFLARGDQFGIFEITRIASLVNPGAPGTSLTGRTLVMLPSFSTVKAMYTVPCFP